MSPKPGEIWLADLGLTAKTRPVLIISRHDLNPPRKLAIYITLTTQNRHSAYEVPVSLHFLNQDSVLNVQGIGSIPTMRLERKLGAVSSDVTEKVRQAILFALDME